MTAEQDDGRTTAEGPDWPELHGPELPAVERRRRWGRVAGVVGAIVLVAAGAGWLTRKNIADNVIAGQLESLGLSGTYDIESIGPRRQVIENVVIGDPRHPDLTIARAIVEIEPRLGFPSISRVTLVKPRLYGTWNGPELSFGTLDKVLFGGKSAEPFRLPDMNLAIEDGRGRILGDHGPIGLKLDGAGPLRGGFAGTVAAVAPRLLAGGCVADGLSLYGKVRVSGERPGFDGPARLTALDCGPGGARARGFSVAVRGEANKDLRGGRADLNLAGGAFGLGSSGATGLNGRASVTHQNGNTTARYDLIGRGLATQGIRLSTLAAEGTWRLRGGRHELEGTLDGGGLRLGDSLASSFASWQRAADGSLGAPLLAQLRAGLQREERGSRVAGEFRVRMANGETSVVIPQGRVTGGSGAALLALSRAQFASGPGAPRLAGNFTTGGAGLPRIAGRMERINGGDTIVTLTMADYRAGSARLAFPRLIVVQTGSGSIGFSGTAIASGPLPGGMAENVIVPLDGNRSASGVLQLWRHCTSVRFDRLGYANLTLERRALVLCPGPGGAILRSDQAGTRIAVGTPSLDLAGRLGETPIRISSGPAGFAQPGAIYAKAVDIALGPQDTETRFRLADLRATAGREIAGTFAGTDVRLAAVPLDLLEATGAWRFANGRLTVSDAAFRLEDRAQVDRFQPLAARGASLSLQDNRIDAAALLREPTTDREVTRVAIRHDLAAGSGQADLAVDGLLFDKALQPDMLSRQLLGVVANASGTVRGRGRIEWNPDRVTSGGSFTTDGLDFAAAFGPVRGAAGTVVFDDLVNFSTPPGQRLKVASINPGIEVTDGEIRFQLQPGSKLAVEGGTWPFLGGTLRLRPVGLNLGVAETRRYVLDIEGLNAAKFIAQMELANLSATGTFDGSLPLVFDENGGRIEGGLLTSRAPGGNVSYVGALTYKDLSAIANFAFDALKSLDYREMRIAMDGALEGNIVTRVRFDGVKQGAGAKRNFITRRFANLPLQFNVNVRAPFYQLITSFKAMYDPAYIKDPRTIGLLDANGRPIKPNVPASTPPRVPAPQSTDIQPAVSENKR